MVPILVVGTLKKRNDTTNIVKNLLGICTALVKPFQLQFELVATKLVKKKLFIMNDLTMHNGRA